MHSFILHSHPKVFFSLFLGWVVIQDDNDSSNVFEWKLCLCVRMMGWWSCWWLCEMAKELLTVDALLSTLVHFSLFSTNSLHNTSSAYSSTTTKAKVNKKERKEKAKSRRESGIITITIIIIIVYTGTLTQVDTERESSFFTIFSSLFTKKYVCYLHVYAPTSKNIYMERGIIT